MNNRKVVTLNFLYIDFFALERYLEKKAAHGWHLQSEKCGLSKIKLTFLKGEPEIYKYSVDILPNQPIVSRKEFEDSIKSQGWKLISDDTLVISKNKDIYAQPIQGDNTEKFRSSRGLFIISTLILSFMPFLILFFYLGFLSLTNDYGPIEYNPFGELINILGNLITIAIIIIFYFNVLIAFIIDLPLNYFHEKLSGKFRTVIENILKFSLIIRFVFRKFRIGIELYVLISIVIAFIPINYTPETELDVMKTLCNTFSLSISDTSYKTSSYILFGDLNTDIEYDINDGKISQNTKVGIRNNCIRKLTNYSSNTLVNKTNEENGMNIFVLDGVIYNRLLTKTSYLSGETWLSPEIEYKKADYNLNEIHIYKDEHGYTYILCGQKRTVYAIIKGNNDDYNKTVNTLYRIFF